MSTSRMRQEGKLKNEPGYLSAAELMQIEIDKCKRLLFSDFMQKK